VKQFNALKEDVDTMTFRCRSPFAKALLAALAAVLLLLPIHAGAHSVYYSTGSYLHTDCDLKLTTGGGPLQWVRSYRSNQLLKVKGGYQFIPPSDGPFGYGWNTPWTAQVGQTLIDNKTVYSYRDPRGLTFYFLEWDSAGNPANKTEGLVLKVTSSGFEVDERGGLIRTFNKSGALTSITDQAGRVTNLKYDASGFLTSVSNAAGKTYYTVNSNLYATVVGNNTIQVQRVEHVTDLAGRAIYYNYDDSGNLTSITRDGKTVITYTYNKTHGLTSMVNAIGETWRIEYLYPDKGITSRIFDPYGRMEYYRYSFQTRTFYVTDYTGATKKFILDDQGRVIYTSLIKDGTETALSSDVRSTDGSVKSTDASGNVTQSLENEWGEVVATQDPEGGTTQTTYNDYGKPTSILDPVNALTTIDYDATHKTLPATITRAKGASEEVSTNLTYSATGDLASTTTGGATTNYDYNDSGLPITVTDPLKNKSQMEYDSLGNLTATVDANGNRSELGYDKWGNLTSTKDPLGNVTNYGYDAAGKLNSITDPLNRNTAVTTDFEGRMTAQQPPVGAKKQYEYDGNGNLTKVTIGDSITTYTYDNLNRLSVETDPEGNITRYEYNIIGCTSCGSANSTPKKITDPLGHVMQNSFDKTGRVTSVTDPLNNTLNIAYDKGGRVISRTDANGNTKSYVYDLLGRVKSQTDANGGATSFAYDKRGNLLSLVDPNGNTTSFEYDLAGRKTKETRPEGQVTIYSYYPNGLLQSVKDTKGQLTTYIYDKANRLIETDLADGTKNTFSYDITGNMAGYTSPAASGSIVYDAANRKTSETVSFGSFSKTYSYTYDDKGNKASFTTPEGTAYNYTYNKNNQPTQITTPAGAISLAYQWIRQTKITLPNGIVTDYSYNDASWLSQINANNTKVTPPVPLTTASYAFDNVGNITGKTTDVGAHSYGYDKLYQLTQATIPTLPQEIYTYDNVGNRLTSAATQGAWSYNKNNELQGYSGVSFGYDANSNTVAKTDNGATTNYAYNAQDRLETVQLPDGNTANYSYDPFGRRIGKKIGDVTTYFLYADEGLIGEYNAVGDFNKGYGWRPNGNWGTDPLLMVEDEEYYFYHNDHLGTPQKMTDVDGDVVWSATYWAFGAATVDPEAMVLNLLRFPGQYFDEETGLNYNWNRYYDTNSGRYVSLDPIQFNGKDENLFRYCKNNPLLWMDFNGLAGGPINGHLANNQHPVTNVTFSDDGYPIFNAIISVDITMTGNRQIDSTLANLMAGLKSTPDGFVWHHNENETSMQLVDKYMHSKTAHSGGVAKVRARLKSKCPKPGGGTLGGIANTVLIVFDAVLANKDAAQNKLDLFTQIIINMGYPVTVIRDDGSYQLFNNATLPTN